MISVHAETMALYQLLNDLHAEWVRRVLQGTHGPRSKTFFLDGQ
jgi:hypothetical protein